MSGRLVIDTDDWASDAQVDRWRAMSPAEKLTLVDELCQDVDTLARIGIRRDHPEASESEVLWHLAARRYDAATAEAVYGPAPS